MARFIELNRPFVHEHNYRTGRQKQREREKERKKENPRRSSSSFDQRKRSDFKVDACEKKKEERKKKKGREKTTMRIDILKSGQEIVPLRDSVGRP